MILRQEHPMKRLSLSICAVLLHCTLLPFCVQFRAQAQQPNPVAGTGRPAAPSARAGQPVVNVMNYGAVGDGVADDTAAITNAMNFCTAKAGLANGCTLYFPAGVYITTGLTLQSFVHMKGDGWGTSVIQLKPQTAADVLTVPVSTFNFSIYGLTLDGNSRNRGTGNCLSFAPTPVSPAEWNTANKQAASINAQKWGHVEEVMFSNCSADGVHIDVYNYALFFSNFYAFNNGVYGVYTQGANSGFTNFLIERSGVAGIHIANANNRFTSGEVIWNGARRLRGSRGVNGANGANGLLANGEAAVYVSGGRNIITAVEAEDNYGSGFFDNGSDDEFIGCVSDSNGYARSNPDASSRAASGFLIGGKGGVYIGDKVTSYRGRLADGNYTTEWPYTMTDPTQSRIDISYDSTNQPPPTIAPDAVLAIGAPGSQEASPGAGHATCIKSSGPPVTIGFCSTAIDSTGSCTCN
jgi:hypothetical protein